jgi:hypothetical protein
VIDTETETPEESAHRVIEKIGELGLAHLRVPA